MPNLILYNTLSKGKEVFKSIKRKTVGLYTCGPTVYDYDHIGHAWNYFNSDILRRVLEYNGYKVKQVMNITDVGHLTSDADTGEDKIEKSAKEKGKTAWEIASFFTRIYLENRKKLNFEPPKIICKVTDHIAEMIKLIEVLQQKGFAYQISDGIYFDTAKFPSYGKLSGNTLEQLKEGARVEINPEKRNPTDFALWKFTPPGQKRQMEWRAFGRMGFPGWHIECSAMSMKYLGSHFDLHTGGEDNIFPHHECEIAQSEAATGQKFVNFWFHCRFLQVENEKMSKSKHNSYTLADLARKGFAPMDLRYLFLTSHYRTMINFTWRSLEAAKIAREKLNCFIAETKGKGKILKNWQERFLQAVNDDLNMPKATALIWELLKSKERPKEIKATILDFDHVLGLGLAKIKKVKIPRKIISLAKKRENARKEKNWVLADQIRKEIENLGYVCEDQKTCFIIRKTKK